MAIVAGRPDAQDIMSLQLAQAYAGEIMPEDGQNVLDPDNARYDPNLIPRDAQTGEAFTDTVGDPEHPDYNKHDPRTKLSIWDVAKDDWVTTKLVDFAARQAFDDDPDFVPPWNELPERYDPYVEAFEAVKSADEWNYVRYRIDQSLAADEYMSGVGFKDGAAYFGIQMLDPALVPLYLINLPFSIAGKSLTPGKAIAQTALRAGAYTTAEAGVIEGVLQATDPTRTLDESVTTLAASAIMGATFGAAGQAVVQRFGRKAQQAHEETREVMESALIAAHSVDGDSVGARGLRPTLAEEKPLANPTRFITLRSPTWRLLYDDVSAAASEAVDRLVPHNLLKRKHLSGKAVEEAPLYSQIMQERERNTARMILAVRGAKASLKRAGKRFSDDEIGVMIGRAARRGDVPEHPELQEAVNLFRQTVDDWGRRAVKAGLVTEEALQEVTSYFPRLYDVAKISRHYSRWRDIITAHFALKYPELLPAELEDIATSIHHTLMQTPVNQMHMGGFTVPSKVLSSGHLKARTLDISDVALEEFLVDDARYVMQHYMRSIAPAVLARETFGADDIQLVDGYPVIMSILKNIDQEYSNAINRLPKGANTTALNKQRSRALDDMKYLMSSVLGTGNPHQGTSQGAQWGRVISSETRSFTAAATLGGMVVASVSDLANLILDHGLLNLIRSVPAILMPRTFSRSAKVDFDAMAIGLDTLLSTRMLRMADLEDRSWNAFARGIGGQQIATGAFKVFGANLWNSWMKRAVATAAQNRILSDSLKYASLSQVRRAKLAMLGVDEATAKRFAANLTRQTSQKRQGVYWADIGNWDARTASKFERILFRDVETTIVTPQAGDMPKILDNGVGLLVAQFKRFVMAHQIQIMTQASQRLAAGDLAVLNYITAMAGLALFSEYSRLAIKNGFDFEQTSKDFGKYTPSDLVFKAVDRAAGLSFGTDLLMGIDGLTDGKTGQMLGFSDQAKYTPYGLGLEQRVPGAGYVSKGIRTVDAVTDQVTGQQPFSQKDLHALRQMIPLQNTFYLAWLFDRLEKATAETLNLPESSAGSGKKRYAQ